MWGLLMLELLNSLTLSIIFTLVVFCTVIFVITERLTNELYDLLCVYLNKLVIKLEKRHQQRQNKESNDE